MQFNPTDKHNSLIASIDFLLFGDSSSLNTKFSLIDRTREINEAVDEVSAILYLSDPMYKWDDTTNEDFPLAKIDLVANRDHYTLLDTAAVINRVRVKDRLGNYRTLTPKLKSELSDSELDSYGDPSYYYKVGGAVFPVPIPNYGYTEGVELEFQRGGNHFSPTDTDAEPGFNPQFHKYLAVAASLVYAISNGMDKKEASLARMKTAIADAMRTHYGRRSPDERPRLRLKGQNVSRLGL